MRNISSNSQEKERAGAAPGNTKRGNAGNAGAGSGVDVFPAAIYHPATFHGLEKRLRENLAERIRRGEISERQLARRTGYTQPHVHNVLKGVRRFHPDLADAVLQALRISLPELLGEGNGAAGRDQALAPLWRGVVGPRHRFPEGAEVVGFRPFPNSFLERFSGPVLLRVAPEEDGMFPVVQPGDLLLLDRSEAARQRPVFEAVYALSVGGRGAVCRCRVVSGALVLIAENRRRTFPLPDHVALDRRQMLDVVRGRVVWTSHELD